MLEHQRGPARPFLIIVPAQLLDQWITEIASITPTFQIHKYYGDYRLPDRPGVTVVKPPLSPMHPLLNGMESNAEAIIITSPHTLAKRHGPRAQSSWRRQNGRDAAYIERYKDMYDPSWNTGLAKMFDTVVLDEAHAIKNEDTELNITMDWLDADFYIFLSATPLLSGIRDYRGFLKLIEPKNAAELWHPNNLEAMHLVRDVNPYLLRHDHPGAILRATLRAADTFIFKTGISAAIGGYRLRDIWAASLIRRTYVSRVPYSNPLTIGEHLPKVHATIYETSFSPVEQTQYDSIATDFLSRLVYTDKTSGRPRWSFGNLRKLSLACIWPDILSIEERLKASSMPMWIDNENFIWTWLKLIGKGRPEYQIPDKQDRPGLLKCLATGSPKLRMLLKDLAVHAVRDEEKHLIWCRYPATQLFVYGALRLANVDAMLFSAALNAEKRQQMIERFNDTDEGMIMVATYSMGSLGLNLQKRCWRVIMFDPPPNIPLGVQSVGRVRRLGNPSNVIHVHEYYLRKSFNDRLNELNIQKMLPNVMAEMADSMVSGGDEDAEEGIPQDDEDVVDVGKFVLFHGEAYYKDDAAVAHLRLPVLTPEEVLRHIISLSRGTHVQAG